MFNDGNEKKQFIDDALDAIFVAMLVFIIIVLALGLSVAYRASTNANLESEDANAQSEPLSTVEYEELEPSENFTFEKVELECEHNWVISEKDSTLIRIVNLECVASEGIAEVYLTRHREIFNQTISDIYIAYDENLEDITLEHFDGVFKIEYFPAGEGMGTPCMEEYEFTLYDCENCNEYRHVPDEKLTMYKFYIPEGSYLISH